MTRQVGILGIGILAWRQTQCKAMCAKFGGLGITLPETNIFAPRNGWLEYDPFLLGRPIFRCYVSFREGKPRFMCESCANYSWKRTIYIYIFFFFFQTCSYPHLTGSEARIFRGNFTIKEIFRIMVPNHGEYHIGVCEKRATCWLLVVPNQVLAAGVSCTDEESRTPL